MKNNNLSEKFQNMVFLASGMNTSVATMTAVRNTATGRLIAAGKNGRKRATDNIIQAMLRRGVAPEDMLYTLQKDAMGEEFFFQGKRRPGNNEEEDDNVEETSPVVFTQGKESAILVDVFETITLDNKQVFTVLGVEEGWNGQMRVKVRMTPHWMNGVVNTRVVVVNIPNPELKEGDERRLSEDGHAIITLPGCQPRIYRPRLMVVDGKLHMENMVGWLKSVMVMGLNNLMEKAGDPNANTVEEVLNSVILEEFMKLPAIQQKTKMVGLKLKQTAAALIHRGEYPLYVPPTKDVLVEWEMREQLLRLAAAGGFDILSTSKNKPGELAYKAGRLGIPSYLWAINPFAQYMDPKRRPEPREIKQREVLHKGKLPTVRMKGTKLPLALAEGMTELVVMIADTNLNEWGQDTLLCTDSLIEKTKLAMFDIECVDFNDMENKLRDLEAQGFDLTKLSINQREEAMGGGLIKETWIITVESEEGIRDLGKIKSIGAIKGVPSLMPGVKLFCAGREIDLIVPRETITRKKCLDVWLYMAHEALAYSKGETEVEIDPNEELDVMVECLEAEMDHFIGNAAGIQDIYDENGKLVGAAFVGALPFFRPTQTKIGTFRVRGEYNPISLELHAAIMAGTNLTLDETMNEKFTNLVNAFVGVSGNMISSSNIQEGEDVSYQASR